MASLGRMLGLLVFEALSLISQMNEVSATDTKDMNAIGIKEVFRYRHDIASKATDFQSLVARSNVFVDKTLFIKEMLENVDYVVMITRPRKWGKSINLSMLKTFLEIPLNTLSGGQVAFDGAPNYRLFKYGEVSSNGMISHLKEPLMISKHDDLLDTYLAKHPVLMVSLANIRGSTFMEMIASFASAMSHLYGEHMYLKDRLDARWMNEELSYTQRKKARLKKEFFEKVLSQRANVQDMKDSLFFLTRVMSQHFNKTVYILIDDYDTAIHNMFFKKNIGKSHKTQYFNFIMRFMEFTFKQNTFCAKGVITGVQALYEPRVFSSILNATRITCLDDKFSQFFGFTDTELNLLFDQLRLSPNLTSLATQRYRITSTSRSPPYDPYSIASFVAYRNVRDFWTETGSSEMLLKAFFVLPTFRDQITNLINGFVEYISYSDLFLNSKDLLELEEFFEDSDETYEEVVYVRNVGLSVFFSGGYLTLGDGVESTVAVLGMESNHTNTDHIRAKIPNTEIRDEIKAKFLKHCVSQLSIDIDHPPVDLIDNFDLFVKNLHGSNATLLTKAFDDFLSTRPRGITVSLSPWVYALFKYLVIHVDPVFQKFANEATPDTPDIVLRKPNYAVIIEFSAKSTTVKKALQKAREYESKYSTFKTIKTVKLIGIRIFSNRTVQISSDVRINR